MVTGGAGFIGTAIVKDLLSHGVDVLVLDNLSPAAHGPDARTDALARLPTEVDLRLVDITDLGEVTRAVGDVDAVSHQAARVGLGINFGDVTDYVHDNDLGTAVLLKALWDCHFRGRLVVASSMVVYGEGTYRCPTHGTVRPDERHLGDLQAGRFDPRCPACADTLEPVSVDEDTNFDPRNTYAATKAQTEHLAFLYGRDADVAVAALRYHNVYGPGMPRNSPYAGVASIFRSALANGRAPQVTEDGQQRRDFIHVTDIAHANIAALLDRPTIIGAFNIATGTPHTVLDLANTLTAATGDRRLRPMVTGEWRTGDVRHITASPRKAAEQLGFEATVPFVDGINEFAHTPLRH